MHKIIFGRKGFDSSAGAVASPLFPSGELCSLPIPEPNSGISYNDVGCSIGALGSVVKDLSSIGATDDLHLDPDLEIGRLSRRPIGWTPLLGQCGHAQSHLQNQKVSIGDIFLFFGWFQKVHNKGGKWQSDRTARNVHLMFGWLQIGQIVPLNLLKAPAWASYHPHIKFQHPSGYALNNTLYIATPYLTLDGNLLLSGKKPVSGGGAFKHEFPELYLTAAGKSRRYWDLPDWFDPYAGGITKSPLSYHGDKTRWVAATNRVHLETVGRGQEFVLDCCDYPQSHNWLEGIFSAAIKAGSV